MKLHKVRNGSKRIHNRILLIESDVLTTTPAHPTRCDDGIGTNLHSPVSSVILGLLTDREMLPVGSSSMAFLRHRDANSRDAIGIAPESALKHVMGRHLTHHGLVLNTPWVGT